MSAARILLVSDDPQLRALLCELLAAHRYDVVAVNVGAAASLRRSTDWDAAIIDAAAAHGAARWAHRLGAEVPTLALAATKTVTTTESLWHRVDAVLHEPFEARKLLLIMRGLFASRRAKLEHEAQVLRTGPLTLHALLNTARVDTRDIALTGVETRILRELMLTASTPVPRERLSSSGLGRASTPADRCLDSHIKRLRRKLGNDLHGRTPIRTVRSVGYLLLERWQPAG
jgi:DNA-binding response OmpR family regulator